MSVINVLISKMLHSAVVRHVNLIVTFRKNVLPKQNMNNIVQSLD